MERRSCMNHKVKSWCGFDNLNAGGALGQSQILRVLELLHHHPQVVKYTYLIESSFLCYIFDNLVAQLVCRFSVASVSV